MSPVEVTLIMLLVVVASGYLMRALPVALPLPMVQIALGAAVSGISGQRVALDPDIFFVLFLPPLLFLDGWRIPKDGLLRDGATILQLALGLVVFTVIGAGFLIHWLIPAMPLAVAFALAAIVSPTDPVAVSSIGARIPIPERLMHILEGESLLNDATGLVCFRFAVAAAITGQFSLGAASLTFLWLALGGLTIGVAATLGVTLVHRWLTEHVGEEDGASILINLMLPFGAYLLAEQLHASGILAAVAAGITMSYVELSGRALASTRVQRAAVWKTVQMALNGMMFVLLGEQLPVIVRGALTAVQEHRQSPWALALDALTIAAGLVLLRLIWVWASLRMTLLRARLRGAPAPSPDWRLVLATSLAGARGTITLAGILTLPLALPDGTPFPARDLAIFLAAVVILLTLAIASIGLPRALQGLTLPDVPKHHPEEDWARREAAVAAVAAVGRARQSLPQSPVEAELYDNAAAYVTGLYERRLGWTPKIHGVDVHPDIQTAERKLRLIALRAERDAVLRLARQAEISDAVSRRLVREIDLLESRYQ